MEAYISMTFYMTLPSTIRYIWFLASSMHSCASTVPGITNFLEAVKRLDLTVTTSIFAISSRKSANEGRSLGY